MNTKKNLLFSLVVFLVITGAGASDYIGPNRSTTTYVLERKQCFYTANVGAYGCHLNLYTDPNGSCPSAGSTKAYFTNPLCGPNWPGCGANCNPAGPSASIVGCSSGDQGCRSTASVTTYPEATVAGNIACSDPGAPGWCKGAASLEISSNEPVAGYSIQAVEGTRNGVTFACAGATCSVPLLEGNNDFSFWALSSWGDSSRMGSVSEGVDTQPPLASGQLAGVAGANGWFVSDVSATVTASDATSGVGSIVYTLDGGSPTAYSGPVTLSDGSHTIVFGILDRAGNSSSVTLSANVDTGLPAVAIDPPGGTAGDNGWYVSGATISGSATDAGSGLATLEYTLDGGASTAYAGPVPLGDGTHTVVFTATDQAGNSASQTATVNVDTLAPQLNLNAPGSFCPACGQTLALDYSFDDGGGGVAEWTLLVDGTPLANGAAAETGTLDWDGAGLALGAHTLTLQGKDLAGNTAQIDLSVTIQPPAPSEPTIGLQRPVLRRSTVTASPKPASTSTNTGGIPSAPTKAAPTATRTNSILVALANPPEGSNPSELITGPASTTSFPANGALFGAEAAAVISAAMAVVVAQQRKREEEEAQAAAAAAAFNATQIALEEERREQAWQKQQQKKDLEQAKAAFQAALGEARGYNMQWYDVDEYISMAERDGYAAATAALQAWIQNAKNKFAQDQEWAQEFNAELKREADEAARKAAEEKAREEAAAAAAAQQAAAAAAAAQQAAAAAEAEKNKPWWQQAGDWIVKQADNIYTGIKGIYDSVAVSHLQFNQLDSGNMSVSADTPPGTRLDYKAGLAKQHFDIEGTYYTPETLKGITADGLMDGATDAGSIYTAGALSAGINLYEYGKGSTSVQDFANRTVGNQQFWVSTAVDTVVAIGVGIAAAAIVGAAITAATPLLVAVAATAGVAILIGAGLDAIGVPDLAKKGINKAIDGIKSLFHW